MKKSCSGRGLDEILAVRCASLAFKNAIYEMEWTAS